MALFTGLRNGSLILDPGVTGNSTMLYNINGIAGNIEGVDAADADSFKLSQSANLGTNDQSDIDTSLYRSLPSQPSFLIYLNGETNVTGDGTQFNIGSQVAGTVITDKGGTNVYAGGGGTPARFTAPVGGVYFFGANLYISALRLTGNNVVVYLVATSGTYKVVYGRQDCDRAYLYSGITYLNYCFPFGIAVQLNAGDTAYCRIIVSGGSGAKTLNMGFRSMASYPGAGFYYGYLME